MELILDTVFLVFLAIFTQLCCVSTAHVVPLEVTQAPEDSTAGRRISPDLYDSLEELARMVDVSYCVGTTGVQKPFECLSHCREFKGFELITTWHTGPVLSDSCGYIALSHSPSPKRIIVAFRGTYSITNTVVDLSAYQQEYVPYPVGNDSDSDTQTPKCSNCFVHAGFMAAWRTTRPTILETVAAAKAQYPNYTLTLIGHSLGGAVAALAGTEMQLRGWEPVVTTFGEPKVGNKAFVKFLDAIFHLDGDSDDDDLDSQAAWRFRRVTHVNDPVPLLPLREWGYEMHAGEIYISRGDLPFSVDDAVFCRGDHDENCISGAETGTQTEIDASLLRRPYQVHPLESDAGQQVLVNSPDSDEKNTPDSELDTPPHPLWHLVPSRFRLWELFFAHRDYFLRVGLCVPGGDPTGRW